MIPLTVPEVRKPILRLEWDRLTLAEQAPAWRRRHQHRGTATTGNSEHDR